VQDLSRLRIAKWIVLARLQDRQRAQCCRRQLGHERQRLEAGEQAVPAEHRHEPGQARRGQGAGRDAGLEAEGRQVDQAAAIDLVQGIPAGDQPRGTRDPRRQVLVPGGIHEGSCHPRALHVLDVRPPPARRDVEAHRPRRLRGDLHLERESVLPNLALLVALDDRFAHEILAPVAERERAAVHVAVELADLRQLVLHLEQIGEVGGDVELDLDLDGLLAVIFDLDRLLEAGRYATPPHHR
jgi:hypothetical protein